MSLVTSEIPVEAAPVADEKMRMGNPGADPALVFCSENALWEIDADAKKRGSTKEAGGVLMGRIFKDVTTNKICTVIVGYVPAVEARATGVSVTFTADVWSHAIAEAESFRNPNFGIVGWYHTHPFNPNEGTKSMFLSGDDQGIADLFFNDPGKVALVLDPSNPKGETVISFFSPSGGGEKVFGNQKQHAGIEIYHEKNQPKIHFDLTDQIKLG